MNEQRLRVVSESGPARACLCSHRPSRTQNGHVLFTYSGARELLRGLLKQYNDVMAQNPNENLTTKRQGGALLLTARMYHNQGDWE